MTSPYDLTISTFVRALEQQLAYLRKAEEWAAESKMDHAQLMDAKLTSDMLVSSGSRPCSELLLMTDPPMILKTDVHLNSRSPFSFRPAARFPTMYSPD